MRYIEDIFCRSTSIDVTGVVSEDKLFETLTSARKDGKGLTSGINA